MSEFYVLPADEHPPYATPCPACAGQGVTGTQFEFPVGDAGKVLLCDVICPDCTGCGNGDPEHTDCAPDEHAYPDGDDWDDGDYHGDGCGSCGSGRGWNPVQGFTGEGPDATMVVLRMPCGCAEDRMVAVAP